MRIVRTRSIPRVEDERLLGDVERLHQMLHTPQGLREHDGTRRNLVDNGVKLRRIVAELTKRGHSAPECDFCRLSGAETYLSA